MVFSRGVLASRVVFSRGVLACGVLAWRTGKMAAQQPEDHLSLSSFDFSELTPPLPIEPFNNAFETNSPRKLEAAVQLELDREMDVRMVDPLYAAMGQFRVTQYKEELEALVISALNSESDAFGGVIDSASYNPLIWTGVMLMLSFACFLPLAFYGSAEDVFYNSKVKRSIASRSFRQALFLAIGCGLPKLVDLLSLLTNRSLRGTSGANFVLNLMNVCFTVPNIILILLPRQKGNVEHSINEALFVCFIQWQLSMVSVFSMGYYCTNLAAQTDHVQIRSLTFLVIAFSVSGAFANTTVSGSVLSKRFWVIWQVLRCIAIVWYLFHLKVFVSRLKKHKEEIGRKLMHLNFLVGLLLHVIIIFTIVTMLWPLFFGYLYPVDYSKEVINY